jgi:peroxiredoxin family protein
MMKVTEDDMYDGVEAVINATNFMELSEGGQLLFI